VGQRARATSQIRTDYTQALHVLDRAGVQFVLVGALAARLHGAATQHRRPPASVDVVVDGASRNLAALAEVLSTELDARFALRLHDLQLPLVLDAGTFEHLPILPLITRCGPLNVISAPALRGWTYAELAAQSPAVQVNGTPVHVAGPAALIDGMLGVAGTTAEALIAGLRRIETSVSSDQNRQHRARCALPVEQPMAMDAVVLDFLRRRRAPGTVREIFLDVRAAGLTATYTALRRAAERLTEQGLIVQERRATANVYRLDDDRDAQVAAEIAKLLSTTTGNPADVASDALRLLAPDKDPPARFETRPTPPPAH
jgi:predicted transcriptional regulator